MTGMKHSFQLLLLVVAVGVPAALRAQGNPILFVTQTPMRADNSSVVSTFDNHQAGIQNVYRGGDLWIRYPDATLKNLTRIAGYGEEGHQGENAIAVRDPHVHWSGAKAIISMVVGAAPRQFRRPDSKWQLYEVSGLGRDETPVITPVPNQPTEYNNVNPAYGTNGRIIFASDRPRDGSPHLYPQLDEYEEQPTTTGLWSLDPAAGDLFLMEHSPSGSFEPFVDSYGRVIFTRWDHLQRDQQADADHNAHVAAVDPVSNPEGMPGGLYGTFDFSDESAGAQVMFGVRAESFPEPTGFVASQLEGTAQNSLRFNHFFPWMINEDGTELETLNHVGRHELHRFFSRSFSDDPALQDFVLGEKLPIENMFHISEDPTASGTYLGTDANEFTTHSSGILFTLTGAPGVNPEDMQVTYLTHPDTADPSVALGPGHSGLYRDPIRAVDGSYIASHTLPVPSGLGAAQLETPYDFRIRTLKVGAAGYLEPDVSLTGAAGIQESLTWWHPDYLQSYDGPLWELQPVEVVARPMPATSVEPTELPGPESAVFTESDADLDHLRDYLRQRDLALVIVRDTATRDDIDVQQPFRIRIDGNAEDPPGEAGQKIYDVKYLQFYQGDQVRGIGMRAAGDSPSPGRRVLARPMHEGSTLNDTPESAPPGGVQISPDGSIAAIVPARRALSWQLVAADGAPVVRERYWISFQPGEVRSCTSCHGLNREDQAGRTTPQNEPMALTTLLSAWKAEIQPPDTRLTAIAANPDGSVTLTFNGPAELAVMVQQSQDLLNWTDLGLSTLTGSDQVFTASADLVPVNAARCFFRLVLAQP